MKSPSKTWTCLGNRKVVSWKRQLQSLPCAARLRRCNVLHGDLLSFLHPIHAPLLPSWTQQLTISSFPQQTCQRSSAAGPQGGLSPAASAASPGGRGKPCHRDPHPGKFPPWAGDAVELHSTTLHLHQLQSQETQANLLGQQYISLWQRQIGLFWPNFSQSLKERGD